MIDQIRCIWHGDEARETASAFGGRAQAKRVPWAIERARCVIGQYGRRSLEIRETGEAIGPAEQSLINLLLAIRDDDRPLARMHAAWLVRGDAVERLLRALAPAAEAPALARYAA